MFVSLDRGKTIKFVASRSSSLGCMRKRYWSSIVMFKNLIILTSIYAARRLPKVTCCHIRIISTPFRSCVFVVEIDIWRNNVIQPIHLYFMLFISLTISLTVVSLLRKPLTLCKYIYMQNSFTITIVSEMKWMCVFGIKWCVIHFRSSRNITHIQRTISC